MYVIIWLNGDETLYFSLIKKNGCVLNMSVVFKNSLKNLTIILITKILDFIHYKDMILIINFIYLNDYFNSLKI